MLDINTAILVRKAIDEYFLGHNTVSLEAICRMQPVVQDTNGSGYTILALQRGDLTILVWIQFSEKPGVIVRRVKTQAW